MNIILPLFLSFLLVFSSYGKIENKVATNNGSNILYVGGDGPNNYTSIQDAIDDANDGDTVFVYSGNYHEYIRIYKSINLIGEDEKTTIIDGMNETNVTVFSIEANYVNFSHFTIRNVPGGYWVRGILIEKANYVKISNCIIIYSEGLSIYSSNNIYIENSNISYNLGGMDILESNNLEIRNCTISYNLPRKDEDGGYIGGYGILVSRFDEPSANISIINCSIHNNGRGIEIGGISNIFISNCDINTYNFSGIGISSSVSNCTILNCNISHGYVGIDLHSADAKVERCVITENFWGIRMGSISKDAKVFIRYNNIKNNSYGIYICTGILNSCINYNNIYNNGIGIKAELVICDARYNYWGSPLGPSCLFGLRGDKIQTTLAKVFYFPWLIEETL